MHEDNAGVCLRVLLWGSASVCCGRLAGATDTAGSSAGGVSLL